MKKIMIALLPALLFACSTTSTQKETQVAPEQKIIQPEPLVVKKEQHKSKKPENRLNGEVLYELLSAEIAGRRGKMDFALDHYLRAADQLNSAYIAERAANIARYQGDDEAMEKAIKRWLELAPNDFEAHKALFSLYLRQKDQARASAAAIALYQSAKDKVFALQVVSGLLLKEKKSQVAFNVLKDLLKQYPDNKDLLFVKAKKLLDKKELSGALASINKVLSIAPDYIDAYIVKADILQKSTKGGMVPLLQKAITDYPEEIKLRLAMIRYLTEQKQFAATKQHLQKAYSLAKNKADLVFAVGLIAIEARQYDEAEKYLKRAIKLGAHHSVANYYLGRVAAQKGNWQQAIAYYSLVEAGIHRMDAQLRIVEMYIKLNKLKEARQHLHLLRANYPKNDPRNVEFILYEAELLRTAGQHQEAYQVLEKGIKQFPDNVDLLYSHALSADKIGKSQEFERDLRIILGKEPKNAQALNALGYFLVSKTERLQEAERLLIKAIKLEPNDAAIIDSIGWLKYKKGHFEDAFKWLKRAYNKLFDPEISAHLGVVYWHKGDKKRAREIWYKALKSFPDDPELKQTLKKYGLPTKLKK